MIDTPSALMERDGVYYALRPETVLSCTESGMILDEIRRFQDGPKELCFVSVLNPKWWETLSKESDAQTYHMDVAGMPVDTVAAFRLIRSERAKDSIERAKEKIRKAKT